MPLEQRCWDKYTPPISNNDNVKEQWVSYKYAARLFLVDKREWEILCSNLPKRSKKSNGKIFLEKEKVCPAIMSIIYSHDPAKWLAAKIGNGCTQWFARLCLPIQKQNEYSEVIESLQLAWCAVQRVPYSEQLCDYIRKHWSVKLHTMTWCDKHQLHDESRVVCLPREKLTTYIQGILSLDSKNKAILTTELMSADDSVMDNVAVFRRAKHIGRHIGVLDEPSAKYLIRYIINDAPNMRAAAEVERLKASIAVSWRSKLHRRAETVGIDPAKFQDDIVSLEKRVYIAILALAHNLNPDNYDDLSEVQDHINHKKRQANIETIYAEYGLTITWHDYLELCLNAAEDPIKKNVVHAASGTSLDDLLPFYTCAGMPGCGHVKLLQAGPIVTFA